MTKNVKIQKIKQVIKQQRDDDLQTLYRQAAEAGVSTMSILQLWYGQVGLLRQPEEVLDFLVRALDIDDGYPAGEDQDDWEEIRTDRDNLIDRMRTDCAGDPWLLRAIIEMNVDEDKMQVAPVLAVLAWMDFDEDEALDIRLEEVDLLGRTIRGRKIHDALYHVITGYYWEEESYFAGGNRAGADGDPEAMLAEVLNQFGLSYQEIRMAGRCYRLRQKQGHDDQTPI